MLRIVASKAAANELTMSETLIFELKILENIVEILELEVSLRLLNHQVSVAPRGSENYSLSGSVLRK